MKSVREFVAEDDSRYRWIVQGGLANLDCFVPLSELSTEHLHMRMSIRDLQRLLQEAADIFQEIGSDALGRCEEQACLAVAIARCPNQETGRALCAKHWGPEDVATQGYRWSNLWDLGEIARIAQELGIALSDLALLETWWHPIPMSTMAGLVSRDEQSRPAHVDLGYQADIDGRTAIVWSEEFGEVIHAQWVLAASESQSGIGESNKERLRKPDCSKAE
jgi:hypothetical protein